MTKSVLLYGNCQLGGVFAVINLINCKYEHIICHKTQLTESEFEQKLQNCDILITQNIADNYRGKNYLGTNWAIKKCLSTTPIVIVDTCYFKTYFYDFINSPSWAMSVSTYCYKSMIDYIINNKTIDEYIDEVVNNENHISKSRVFEFLKADIDELNRRANYCEKRYGIHPNVKFIHVANFIENNFDKQVLFHSVNHPSAVLLGHIASELLLARHGWRAQLPGQPHRRHSVRIGPAHPCGRDRGQHLSQGGAARSHPLRSHWPLP